MGEKAEMLDEYVSFGLSKGALTSLPNAVGVTSDNGLALDSLPLLLVRLCAEVNWAEEKACFSSLCRCCADFCVEALLPSEEDAEQVNASKAANAAAEAEALNAAVESGEFEDVVAAAAASSRKRARTVGPNAL